MEVLSCPMLQPFKKLLRVEPQGAATWRSWDLITIGNLRMDRLGRLEVGLEAQLQVVTKQVLYEPPSIAALLPIVAMDAPFALQGPI